jgi:hypothetical protein
MSFTLIEKHQAGKHSSAIAVRPYVDHDQANMGLEKYQMSLFDGVFHEEQLACLEQNGIRRYVTGLNEFAPELKDLPQEQREARIKEIRKIVAQLEKELAANIVDPEDREFWNKVRLLKHDNDEFWSRIVVRAGNDPLFLDPQRDPYDLIKLRAIEAGGFSIVAPSLEEARGRATPPKFYLDRFEDTATVRTEVKKLRNRALSELQKLYEKNANKLLYVCKVVDAVSTQYKKSTPLDILYDNMDRYINGETVDRDKRRTAEHFLSVAALDMETLKLRAMIKDASFHKLIATRGDGFIYHLKSSTMMGKNPSDLVEFLKNPLNDEVLKDLMRHVEQLWNN